MNNFLQALGVTGFAALIVSFVLLGLLWPLVVIWAVNTLFGFAIAYTFWNWLAVLVLTMTFGKANVSVNKN